MSDATNDTYATLTRFCVAMDMLVNASPADQPMRRIKASDRYRQAQLAGWSARVLRPIARQGGYDWVRGKLGKVSP